jgi:activator of 2-hydroxyglutaryl-CoA dehydratase
MPRSGEHRKAGSLGGGRFDKLSDRGLDGRFQAETSIDLASQLRLIQKRHAWDSLVSTGYGRHLSQKVLGGEAVTEIKAYTTSAHHFHKDIATVIDLAGKTPRHS